MAAIAKGVSLMIHLQEEFFKREIEKPFPSFSIIYETENLSSVELDNIYKSLASLEKQDISPESANEFLIVDGGNAPKEVIKQLCSNYSWIKVISIPGISYHAAKMKGATLATGEFVIFCDSDCVYEPHWLRNILTPLIEHPEINIIAGETTTPIRNPYELAIAMNYLFRRFSGKETPYETNHYHLNGVAFRRTFLLQNPIPIDLPLYRGHCKVHTYDLCEIKGYKIWKHPQARAIHEPPTLSFISWRYLLYGRDDVISKRTKFLLTQQQDNLSSLMENKTTAQIISAVIRKILEPLKPKQALEVFQENPSRLIMLPLAIPFILWFRFLFSIGRIIAYIQPDLLLDMYEKKIEIRSP
jgi:glycosyltransferase involved in cell wall biosynthesis